MSHKHAHSFSDQPAIEENVDVLQPEPEVVQETEPVVEIIKETKNRSREMKEVVEVKEDRSAFNCPKCKGEGLMLNGVVQSICDQCNGTGKV